MQTILRGVAVWALLETQAALAVSLRGHSADSSAAQSAEWRACAALDDSDKRFWSAEWSVLERDLRRLNDAASPNGTAPGPNKNDARENHHKSPLSGIKLNLEPKTPMELLPALTMLKGLLEDGKERIGQLNAREAKSKKEFEERKVRHEKRIQTIENRFKNHTLSQEFRTNETRDENHIFSYWERVRERQHKQFHTCLKIQHGTINKVKSMVDMYEKTISGTADKSAVAKVLAKVSGHALLQVNFAQVRKEMSEWCEQALQTVHETRVQLENPILTEG